MPAPWPTATFGGGRRAARGAFQAPTTDIQVKQDNGSLMTVKAGASLADVVKALNALGPTPTCWPSLQAMKAAAPGAPISKSSRQLWVSRYKTRLTAWRTSRLPQDFQEASCKKNPRAACSRRQAIRDHVSPDGLESMRDATPQDGLLQQRPVPLNTAMLDQQLAQNLASGQGRRFRQADRAAGQYLPGGEAAAAEG